MRQISVVGITIFGRTFAGRSKLAEGGARDIESYTKSADGSTRAVEPGNKSRPSIA
jgi:hypothetical protein